MNEQDFMKQIDNQTKDIPIPDSISPENMKKMLDEQVGEWNTFDNDITSSTQKESDNYTRSVGKRNRFVRRFTAAACITLCLVGGVTALHFNNKSLSETSTPATEAAMYDEAEEFAAEATENKETDEDSESLVTQSSLTSPSSYDAYYETLHDAYQAYYDRLATVTNDDVAVYESMDSATVTESESAATGGVSLRQDLSDATNDSAKTQSKEEFSTTNTQEKTVDEGDIIKTDGTYIYKVISKFNDNTGHTDQTLTITETDDGNLKALASIDLYEHSEDNTNEYMNFHEFYLHENYIVLLYTKQNYAFENASTETNIVIYDIADRENPKMLKTLTQSGWYESSRISNGFLYTISNFNDTNLDTPTPYTNYIPSVNGKTIECSNIYYPRDILMQTTYVITSLNLKNPKDFADTAAIPTNGGQTYVSNSSIYFYTTLYDEVTKTEITKVRYDEGILTPGENATIAGYLYDSFALSEYNNHLRIVATIPANNISLLRDIVPLGASANTDDTTSTDRVKVKEDVNVLYVLDDSMQLTGKISGIAPGEQIYSARFMGDIGYFVTFRNIDPLFSVDLSDPTNPTILGQLKIPGFSNYLHSYEDGLLLGFGEEIDANTSEFLGLKLSMFDVSDPTDVQEQDKYIIENSQYSEAQYNHKAMMIDPNKNIFGFVYSTLDPNNYEYIYYYATYTYDKKDGFIETAKYKINDSSGFKNNAVRGVYIGNYFYLSTNKSLTSYEIGSTNPISQVYFK